LSSAMALVGLPFYATYAPLVGNAVTQLDL
jgi:hypothetical protein